MKLEGLALEDAIVECFGVERKPYTVSNDCMRTVEKEIGAMGKECMIGYLSEIIRIQGTDPDKAKWRDMASALVAPPDVRAKAALLIGINSLWGFGN